MQSDIQWNKYTPMTGLSQLTDPDLAQDICVCWDCVCMWACVQFLHCVCVCVYVLDTLLVVAEVLVALLCFANTGSGTLFGRYPQPRVWETKLSNKPMRRGRESAVQRQHGSSLNSCLSNSPSTRKMTKSFPALYTAGMNHPLSPSSALLPVVALVSHLSLLQRLLKVHQDLLFHKSFIPTTVCALAHCFHSICFWGSQSEKFPSCSGITLVNQTRTDSREERRKEDGGRRHARWRVANPNIQNDKWSELFFSAVKCPRDHLSPGRFSFLSDDWANHRQMLSIFQPDWPKQEGEMCIGSLVKQPPHRERF